MKSRLITLAIAALLVAGVTFLATANGTEVESPTTAPPASPDDGGPAVASAPAPVPTSLSSSAEPIAEFQGELLDLAWAAASAMPLDPHVKNRSRAQDVVVATCLELDLPERALRYADGIINWRRGSAYADVAYWYASHADPRDLRGYLDLAARIADASVQGEGEQAWRRDRIRAKMARVHAFLGNHAEAMALEQGVVDSEQGAVAAELALHLDPAAFDAHLRAMDEVLATGNFDQARAALRACASLFERFYDDEGRRSEVEARIKSGYAALPVAVRIDLMLRLVGSALERDDAHVALDLLGEAEALVARFDWLPEDYTVLAARLARERHRAGDDDGARALLARAMDVYERERARIVDIYRAGALRPVAAAYQSLGDPTAALALFERAVEEGQGNPNSRPRADDVSATCCAMARAGVAPGPGLRSRLEAIVKGLGHPW